MLDAFDIYYQCADSEGVVGKCGLGQNNMYICSLDARQGLDIQQGMSVWVDSPKSQM